jgi:hypothetical protein
MSGKSKIKFWFYLVYRLLLLLALALSIIYMDILNILLSLLTLFLTFLPTLVERRWHVHYPTVFEFAIMIFIFCSLVLGSILSFYERFPRWDMFLHIISGVIIALIGYSMVYILNKGSLKKVKLSPAFVSLFAFSFAMSIGALWEIYEYFVDTALGWNMQRSGLNDTMSDLIVDAIGALAVAILGYLYMKGKIKIQEKYRKKYLKMGEGPSEEINP